MPAGYQDQYLEQGTTFNTNITLNDNYGNPYNLTGFTVASQARLSYNSPNAAITFATTITSANNGVINLYADANTTANLWSGPMSKLVYDVVITETGSGIVTRVLEGQIFVSPGVTR